MITQRRNVAIVALLLVLLVACTDQQLVNLSRALSDTALAMGSLQTTVIESNKQGLLSDAETTSILLLCSKINAGGKQASALTRNLTKLTPADRGSVLIVLKPILDAVNESIASGLTGIQEPTKSKIILGLQTIQTALNTANVILSATGGK